MRQKIQFSSDIDNIIKSMISEGNSLMNIKSELESKYNFKAAPSTISLRVKELGIDISNNRNKKYNLDDKYDYIIDMMLNYESIKSIAEKLNIDRSTLSKYLNKKNISYSTVKNIKEQIEWNKDDVIDLRSMRDDEINNIINNINGNIIKDYVIEVNGKKFITDFYCPDINTAFVYFGNDESFVRKENKCPVEIQSKWKIRFKKELKNMNVDFYIINYDFEYDEWLVDDLIDELNDKIIKR